jgi:hypothetical protein
MTRRKCHCRPDDVHRNQRGATLEHPRRYLSFEFDSGRSPVRICGTFDCCPYSLLHWRRNATSADQSPRNSRQASMPNTEESGHKAYTSKPARGLPAGTAPVREHRGSGPHAGIRDSVVEPAVLGVWLRGYR